MAVPKKRAGDSSIFSLSCGCRDSKATSVSNSFTRSSDTRQQYKNCLPYTEAPSLSPTASSSYHCINSEVVEDFPNSPTTPSFSDLLRQLGDLERSVKSLGPPQLPPPVAAHRRMRSSRNVRETVAVVKETADPLGDFRRSMLQMIVEMEIVSGEELHKLLHRFIALNSPIYHELILGAFTEIWTEIFSDMKNIPDLHRC